MKNEAIFAIYPEGVFNIVYGLWVIAYEYIA